MKKKEREVGIILITVLLLYLISSTNLVSILGYYNYKIFFEGGIYLVLSIWIWFKPRLRSKGKLKFQQDIIIWSIIISFIYLVTILLAGIVTGFGNNVFDTTAKGIFTNLQTIVGLGIMQQWIKHYIVHKVKKKYKILMLVLVTVFIVISNFRLEQLYSFKSIEAGVSFYASYVLPKLALESLLSYFVYIGGFVPAMIIYIMTTVPFYILPVVPNLNWLTQLLVKTLVPVFGMMFISEIYQTKAKLIKKREKPKEGTFQWVITSVIAIMLVWFVVGVFPVFPTVVLTGSMEPLVYPGDIVLIEKKTYEEIKLEDVLYFDAGGIYIIHRVIEVDGDTFKTKGDNNNVADSDWVNPENVKGIMVGKIPYIGRLSLWIRGNSIDVNQYEN